MKNLTEEERIFKGILYNPGNTDLKRKKLLAHNLSSQYSRTFEDQTEEREAILSQLLDSIGEHCFIQGPIFFIMVFIQKSVIVFWKL